MGAGLAGSDFLSQVHGKKAEYKPCPQLHGFYYGLGPE